MKTNIDKVIILTEEINKNIRQLSLDMRNDCENLLEILEKIMDNQERLKNIRREFDITSKK